MAEGNEADDAGPAETTPLNLPKLAETIQLLLGSDDLPLNIRIEPEGTMRSLLQAGAHEMALTEATVAGGDPHLLLFPLSTSEAAAKGARAMNFSFYRNPRLDDVLIRASQLSFRSERARLYQRAQAMLAEELPWLPIYVRLEWAVVRPEVNSGCTRPGFTVSSGGPRHPARAGPGPRRHPLTSARLSACHRSPTPRSR